MFKGSFIFFFEIIYKCMSEQYSFDVCQDFSIDVSTLLLLSIYDNNLAYNAF